MQGKVLYLSLEVFSTKVLPYHHLFSRFKKFRKIKVLRKKGAAKIKDAKFGDLYKNLYLSFLSASST